MRYDGWKVLTASSPSYFHFFLCLRVPVPPPRPLLTHDENTISDEEFAFLYDCFLSKNSDFWVLRSIRPRWYVLSWLQSGIPNRNGCSLPTCWCFTNSSGDWMQTEETLWWSLGAVCASEANELPLSMQWHDSTISKTSVCFEFDYQWSLKFYFWKPMVTDWNGNVPNPLALQIYAEAISRKGSPLQNCFGFTNGSVRPTQDLTLCKESFTMDTRECMG